MKNFLGGKRLYFSLIAFCCLVTGVQAQEASIVSVLYPLLLQDENPAIVSWEKKFNLPPQDSEGFSILTPSSDSYLLYVSSSEGDDAAAEIYLPSDSAIGADPYLPQGTIKSFATIAAAVAQTRDGYPDYILLKRGDTWDISSSISLKSGRSASERTVLCAYGDESVRPYVRNGGVQLSKASYSVVMGIYFAATSRNPASSDFVGFDNVVNVNGISLLSGYGGTVTGSVLIEDCRFEWFANNTVQDSVANGGVEPYLTDIVLRRNFIANNYSTLSHSQGFYSAYASVLLEENIFDHNGWYQQGSDNAQEEGMATMFNHNTYFPATRETIFRNNLFLRASSINNKFTSNTSSGTNEIKTWDVLLYNNFYAEGEIVMSIGGNDDQDNGPRWRNIRVIDNVATHLGRTHPTGRSLGWGIGISDWEGGCVTGNILTNWGDVDTLTNTYGIQLVGHTTGVTIDKNIINGVISSGALVKLADGDIAGNIRFTDNIIQSSVVQAASASKIRLLATSLDQAGNTFGSNSFYSANNASTWFAIDDTSYCSFAEYQDATADTSSHAEHVDFVDSGRTLETYLAENGIDTDMDSFVAELAKQSRFNWRQELTAQAINNYFRQGYQVQ